MSEGLSVERCGQSSNRRTSSQSLDTQNISSMPKGFLVRFRQSPAPPIQIYFSYRMYGGVDAARFAAVETRNQLRASLRGSHQRRRRYGNRKNRSGLLGVAWCLTTERTGTVSQTFRAQRAGMGLPGKPEKRSFAVKKFGVWGAYCQAAWWRSKALGESSPMTEAEIAEHFSDYLRSCREEMSAYPERAFSLRQALDEEIEYGSSPDEVKNAIRAFLSGLN